MAGVEDHAWETSKENLVPLKKGRNKGALGLSARAAEHAIDDDVKKQAAEFEEELLSEDAEDDPLEVWSRYVKWAQAVYPADTSEVLALLERCTAAYTEWSQYKNDIRYLRMWILYADMCEEAVDIFAFLESKEIGQTLAKFYEARADLYENLGDFDNAIEAYTLGVNRNAQPVERLKRRQGEFQLRMAERVKQSVKDMAAKAAKPPKKERGALSKITKKQASSGYRASSKHARGVSGGGVSGVKKSSGIKPAGNGKSESFAIFTDENNTAAASTAGASGWSVLPTQKELKKENTAKPSKWNEEKIKQRKKASGSKLSLVKPDTKPTGFDVFVEPGCETEVPVKDPDADKESEPVRLREHLDGAPAVGNQRSQEHLRRLRTEGGQQPVRSQPKRREVCAYNADMLHCGGQELSFEEVRAVRMAYRLYQSPAPQAVAVQKRRVAQPEVVESATPVDQCAAGSEVTPTDIGVDDPVRRLQFEGVYPTPRQTPQSLGRAPRHPSSTPRGILRNRTPTPGRANTPGDLPAPPSVQSENTQTLRPSPTINTKIALNDIMSMFASPLPFEGGASKRKFSPSPAAPSPSLPPAQVAKTEAASSVSAGRSVPAAAAAPASSSLAIFEDPGTPAGAAPPVQSRPSSNKQPLRATASRPPLGLRDIDSSPALDQENIDSPKTESRPALREQDVLQPKMTMRDAIIAQLAAEGSSTYVHVESEEIEDEQPELVAPPAVSNGGFTIFSDEMDCDENKDPVAPQVDASKSKGKAPAFSIFQDFDDTPGKSGVTSSKGLADPTADDSLMDGDDTLPKFDTGVFAAGQDFGGAATLSPEDTIRISSDLLHGDKVPVNEVPRKLSATPKVALPSPSRNGPTVRPQSVTKAAASTAGNAHNESDQSLPRLSTGATGLDMSHTFKSFATPGGGLAGVTGDSSFSRFSSVSAIDQVGDTSFCLSPLTPGTVDRIQTKRPALAPAENESQAENILVTEDADDTIAANTDDVSAVVVENLRPQLSPIKINDDKTVNPFESTFFPKILANDVLPISELGEFEPFQGAHPSREQMADAMNAGTEVTVGNTQLRIRAVLGGNAGSQVYEVEQVSGPSIMDQDVAPTMALKLSEPANDWELHISSALTDRVGSSGEKSSITKIQKLFAFSGASAAFMEYNDQGTLQNVIDTYLAKAQKKPGRCMDESLVAFYAVEITKILQSMHSAGIVHADVRPENFMIRNEECEQLDTWQQDGSGGWSGKGLRVIDYGSSLDLCALPGDVMFLGDSGIEGFRCPEMTENKPWKFQIDAYGLCATIHRMLFGSDLEVVKNDEGRYAQKAALKRIWNVALWTKVFDALLNFDSPDSAAPWDMIRTQLETFMTAKARNVKVNLCKQNIMMYEQQNDEMDA